MMTSAHLASASNNTYLAGDVTNMPIVMGSEPSPYSDTPEPKCFGTVSPLDPQIFSTIAEHVSDLLAGKPNPKYSPVEVAQWMEDCVAASSSALTEARQKVATPTSAEFRRMEEDVLIQSGAGQLFCGQVAERGAVRDFSAGRRHAEPAHLRLRNTSGAPGVGDDGGTRRRGL